MVIDCYYVIDFTSFVDCVFVYGFWNIFDDLVVIEDLGDFGFVFYEFGSE